MMEDMDVFNVKVPFEGRPVTSQGSSGPCWTFAAAHVFRAAAMKKYQLKEFQLSQAYLLYWDKVEKANWFLESVLETAWEETDSRLVQTILATPASNTMQWDMVANLVWKYGLVCRTLELVFH